MQTILGQAQPNLVSSNQDIKRPRGYYKTLIVKVLAVAAAVWAGFALKQILSAGGTPSWMAIVGLSVYGIITTLSTFLPMSSDRRYGFLVLEGLAVVSWFYTTTPIVLGGAVVLMMILLLWGEAEAESIINAQLKMKFYAAAKSKLAKVITGLCLIGAVLYSLGLGSGNLISESMFNTIYKPAADLVHRMYPSIDFNGTLGDLATELTMAQVNASPEFKSLPASAQKLAIEQSKAQVMNSIGGKNSQAADKISSVAYRYFSDFMKAVRDRAGSYFIVVVILLIFMTVRSILVPGEYLLLGVAWFIWELLFATKFIRLGSESRIKEIVEY